MKIKKNGKVIKLTESDLKRIVKRILTEQNLNNNMSAHKFVGPQDKKDNFHWTGLVMDNSTDVFTMSPTDPWEYVVVKTSNSSNLDPNDPIDDEEGLNTTSVRYYTRKKGDKEWIDISNSKADFAKAVKKIDDYVTKNNLKFDKPGIDRRKTYDDGDEWMEDFEDNYFGI